ncbi:MAG: hypothetical protein HQK54_16100, partial [Oligoflexales bacterium]|nr:hypothetical protein [Oligoflexales bacterium]
QNILHLDWEHNFEKFYTVTAKQFEKLESDIISENGRVSAISTVMQWINDSKKIPISKYLGPIRENVSRIAKLYGKNIEFIIEGEQLPIYFENMEVIMMNIIHLIRNAIIHGIEEDRTAIGKREMGRITLSFAIKDENVQIRVSDDGRGVNIERVSEMAIEKGLLTREEYAAMSESEKTGIIFLKGASIRNDTDGFAGRGLGLSAVRDAVIDIGGDIAVKWTFRHGTTFTITIPLVNTAKIIVNKIGA